MPERIVEAEAVEDPLVLLGGARSPVGAESGVPPGMREVAEFLRGDGRSGGALAESSCDVLFRPEEVH